MIDNNHSHLTVSSKEKDNGEPCLFLNLHFTSKVVYTSHFTLHMTDVYIPYIMKPFMLYDPFRTTRFHKI